MLLSLSIGKVERYRGLPSSGSSSTAQETRTQPRLHCGGRVLLSQPSPLPPRVHINRKLESRAELRCQPNYSNTGHGHPKLQFAYKLRFYMTWSGFYKPQVVEMLQLFLTQLFFYPSLSQSSPRFSAGFWSIGALSGIRYKAPHHSIVTIRICDTRWE